MAKKKISRIQDSEIKKQLRNFAKKEYFEKKPLEIRVLQLKPGVVFKKGCMLPNLLIKKLAGTAYVIYLDYGAQLKFYYFAKNGMSMGGSNFDKNDKLLKEMHGKAKTLLKLPKTIKVIGLDEENKKIRQRWEKLTNKYSQKLGIKIKNLPAISIKKNIPENSIRIGIQQDKDILHFDLDYFNTELQDTILLRELFPILTNTPANNETVLMISTIWALILYDSKKYTQILNKISVKRGINKKAIGWIQDILLPYVKNNRENKDNFAQFLLKASIMINQSDVFTVNNFFDMFLLWLMKFGVDRHTQFNNTDEGSRQKSWLFFEMLELFYTQSDLCHNYGINPRKDSDLLLIHLCSRFLLGKESKVSREFMIGINPNNLQMESALENLNLSEFTDLIPEPMFSKNKEFLEDVLFYLLISKGIIVDSEDLIELQPNTEKIIEISIQNRTDWILMDVEFQADLKPPNKLILQKIDPPKLLEFAGDLNLVTCIKSTDKTGKCRLTLKMSFEDPLNPNKIKNSVIKIIDILVAL